MSYMEFFTIIIGIELLKKQKPFSLESGLRNQLSITRFDDVFTWIFSFLSSQHIFILDFLPYFVIADSPHCPIIFPRSQVFGRQIGDPTFPMS